jgi:hypothetical protein
LVHPASGPVLSRFQTGGHRTIRCGCCAWETLCPGREICFRGAHLDRLGRREHMRTCSRRSRICSPLLRAGMPASRRASASPTNRSHRCGSLHACVSGSPAFYKVERWDWKDAHVEETATTASLRLLSWRQADGISNASDKKKAPHDGEASFRREQRCSAHRESAGTAPSPSADASFANP